MMMMMMLMMMVMATNHSSVSSRDIMLLRGSVAYVASLLLYVVASVTVTVTAADDRRHWRPDNSKLASAALFGDEATLLVGAEDGSVLALDANLRVKRNVTLRSGGAARILLCESGFLLLCAADRCWLYEAATVEKLGDCWPVSGTFLSAEDAALSLMTTMPSSDAQKRFLLATSQLPKTVNGTKLQKPGSRERRTLSDVRIERNFSGEYVPTNVASLFTRSTLSPSLNVTYVAVHSDSHYAYVVAVESSRTFGRDRFENKLARLCGGNAFAHSFVEVAVECAGRDVSINPRVTAAAFVGSDLFVWATETVTEGAVSLLCKFSSAEFRKHVGEAQRECFNEDKDVLSPWLGERSDNVCRKARRPLDVNSPHFCGAPDNPALRSRYAIRKRPLVRMRGPPVVASVGFLQEDRRTILFLTTADGFFRKVSVNGHVVSEHLKEKLRSPAFPVPAQSLLHDRKRRRIYILGPEEVLSLPATSCSLYRKCQSCLRSGDPAGCGWCATGCSGRGECGATSSWSTSRCPPQVQKTFPISGPLQGGTEITLVGSSFGGRDADVTVLLGEHSCRLISRNDSVIVCESAAAEESGRVTVKVRVSAGNGSSNVTRRIQMAGSDASTTFDYKEVAVSRLHPVLVTRSGRALVHVEGRHLDAAGELRMSVFGGSCDVVSRRPDVITCQLPVAPPSDGITEFPFRISAGRLTFQLRLNVTADPHFRPPQRPLIVFPGGSELVLECSDLSGVQDAFVRIVRPQRGATSATTTRCRKSLRSVSCRTPEVNLSSLPVTTTATLLLDQFPLVDVNVTYVTAPHFRPFGRQRLQADDLPLVIKGEGLDVLKVAPPEVEVGERRCRITSMTSRSLECQLPAQLNISGVPRPLPVKVSYSGRTLSIGFISVFRPAETSVVAPLVAAAVALPVAVAVAAFFARRRMLRCRKHEKHRKFSPVRNASMLSHSNPLYHSANNNYEEVRALAVPEVAEETRKLLEDEGLLIERRRIQLLRVAGRGHFGCVYVGTLRAANGQNVQIVAVKTLQRPGGAGDRRNLQCRVFIEEALRMRDLQHPHVLALTGVCLDVGEGVGVGAGVGAGVGMGEPLVVIPYMSVGDLLAYVRDARNAPTVKRLIVFAEHVAAGMTYLESLRFVHRDLAARNCMLDQSLTVKIADFGLSRDVYEKDYYSSDDRMAPLPVKWMAPESLEFGLYSSKSDVWSFGVVAWELLTRGVSPYLEVDSWDTLRFLKSGRRMLQPDFCPDQLFELMRSCWRSEAVLRPNFLQISGKIRQILKSEEPLIRQTFSPKYENFSEFRITQV